MSAGFTILLLAFFGTSDFSSNLLLQFDWRAAILFTASLIILRKFKPNPIVLMCVAGLAGFLLYQ
jgi:chromate transporter